MRLDRTLREKPLHAVQVTVILKHVFSAAELEQEPTMKTDLEADMASECAKLGPVDKVYVFLLYLLILTILYPMHGKFDICNLSTSLPT